MSNKDLEVVDRGYVCSLDMQDVRSREFECGAPERLGRSVSALAGTPRAYRGSAANHGRGQGLL